MEVVKAFIIGRYNCNSISATLGVVVNVSTNLSLEPVSATHCLAGTGGGYLGHSSEHLTGSRFLKNHHIYYPPIIGRMRRGMRATSTEPPGQRLPQVSNPNGPKLDAPRSIKPPPSQPRYRSIAMIIKACDSYSRLRAADRYRQCVFRLCSHWTMSVPETAGPHWYRPRPVE